MWICVSASDTAGPGTLSPQSRYSWDFRSTRHTDIKYSQNNEKTSKQINKQKLSRSSTKLGVHAVGGPAGAETHWTSQGQPVLRNPAQPLSWPITKDLISYIYVTGWKILQAPRGKAKRFGLNSQSVSKFRCNPNSSKWPEQALEHQAHSFSLGSLWRVLKSETVSEVFISLTRMKTAQQKYLQASKQIILKFTKRGLSWEVRVKKKLSSQSVCNVFSLEDLVQR